MHRLEAGFREWQGRRDATKAWGWKALGRWLAMTGQRANPDGTLPDLAHQVRAAERIAAEKKGARVFANENVWRPVGPIEHPPGTLPEFEHGMRRVNCVTFHPTDPETMWVGVGQGGVWKTVDGGDHWMPIGDDLPVLRVSDVAVDPNDPDVLYVALGDFAYIGIGLTTSGHNRASNFGVGIYKSTDGGESWSPTGLSFELTDFHGSLIRRVIVDPDDSRRLLAAGTSGIWISDDAGASWRSVSDRFIWDIERSPIDPQLIYASAGHNPHLQLGIPGLLYSRDFGRTWNTAPAPFPTNGVARIEIAPSSLNPDLAYAVAASLDNGFYGLYRTTDGGASWHMRSERRRGALNILGRNQGNAEDEGGQAWYDLAILVDPNDDQRIYVGGINIWGSSDGGSSWSPISYLSNEYGKSIHPDQHVIAWNPLQERFYVCNDGGLVSTGSLGLGSWNEALNLGWAHQWPTEWTSHSSGLAIASFYRLGLGPDGSQIVAGAQDNSTFYYNGDSWLNILYGDGMECAIDPSDPATVYGSAQGGFIFSYNTVTREMSGIPLNYNVLIQEGQGEWTTPFVIDPEEPGKIYVALANLWSGENAENEWVRHSEFSADGIPWGQPAAASAMALSPSSPRTFWVAKRPWHAYNVPMKMLRSVGGGTVGGSWTDVTNGLPDSLYATSIAAHVADPERAWVTFSGFTDGAKIYRTTDGGESWTNITRNLPNLPANTVVHDPESPNNTIYVGMDLGVWYTNDAMNEWRLYNGGLPNVIVNELEIDRVGNRLVAATFGRGVWEAPIVDMPQSVESDAVSAVAASLVSVDDRGFVVQLGADRSVSDLDIRVIDVTGRTVHRRAVDLDVGTRHERFDLDLPYGMYFVVVGERRVVRVTVVK